MADLKECERDVRRRFQKLREGADDFTDVDLLQDAVDELVGLTYQEGYSNGMEQADRDVAAVTGVPYGG